MQLLDAVPKDIHFILEMSMKDLISLKVILDNMEFAYDGKDDTHVEAKRYLEETLFPTVTNLLQRAVKNEFG